MGTSRLLMQVKHRKLPPYDKVASILHYDPETGLCTRLQGNYKGTTYTNGYQTVRINNYRYNVSRLCWLLATKEDPGQLEVDHIDRNPENNAFNNLRLATRSQQLANRRRTSEQDLPKGVSFIRTRGTFSASWGINGKKVTVKGFNTAEEAHLYFLWNTRHHGEFAEDLPISACPPKPGIALVNKRKRNTVDLPKGVSYVKRRRSDGTEYVGGYQASFTNKEGIKTTKRGFKTPEEAHAYYLANRRSH